MPTPSTPSSSLLSQDEPTSDILTPGRKVQALLAEFDSSDSDASDVTKHKKSGLDGISERTQSIPQTTLLHVQRPEASTSDADDDADDEDLPGARRGRLAQRLDSPDNAQKLQTRPFGSGSPPSKPQSTQRELLNGETSRLQDTSDGSEDELLRRAPMRRRLLKRRLHPTSAVPRSPSSSKDSSPARSNPAATDVGPEIAAYTSAAAAPDKVPQASSRDDKNKFFALLEKHRKQRLDMEAAEIVQRAARVDQLAQSSKESRSHRASSIADSSGDDTLPSDNEAGSRLAKEARPTRKATKKALEEMKRETQRMSRNMQLTHQARTKKKITKESLLARFNFPVPVSAESVNGGADSLTASSTAASVAEGANEHLTPPTSPLVGVDEVIKTGLLQRAESEELPELDEFVSEPIPSIDKGKARAVDTAPASVTETRGHSLVRPIRVKWTKEDAVMARAADSGSDSDIEIITSQSKMRKYAVFEQRPNRKAHETESHLILRILAHLGDYGRGKNRYSMNTAEMEASLRRAARLQAQRERQEKIEALKAKGVVIPTCEERERELQEVEDLVEKARQEGAEIQKREREAAKKDGTHVKATMHDDEDEEDEEEDEDFEEEQQASALSGSEAEHAAEASEDEDLEDDADDQDGNISHVRLANESGLLLDDAADEQDSEDISDNEVQEVEGSEGGSDVEKDEREPSAAAHKPRQSRVIVDEDDDDEDREHQPVARTPMNQAHTKTPQSLTRSARKVIPGLQTSDNSPMGLTQAFAATMADSQSPPSTPGLQAQHSLTTVQDLASPNISMLPHLQRLDSIDVVSDSQPATQTQPLNIDVNETQQVPRYPPPDFVVSESPVIQSQMVFEPTQDAGYMLSPFAGSRFGIETPQQEPQSTIDTVIVARASPLVQRKRRLRRGQAEQPLLHGEDSTLKAVTHKSAFDIMDHAAKHKASMPVFDKAKSNAKDIIDEAAEESEDEYAGLGGASDDDVGEEDEDDRQMIDHDTQVGKGDEAKLAGLHADRERQRDEATVSKLLKDITTGALRRKRHAGDDLDLSDEEDEAARRREAKRREYAKMRRELFKDEAVEKIAEDKKKEAFLKSIEDRDEIEDDDVDYGQEESQRDEMQSHQTQDQAQYTRNQSTSESATTTTLSSKRPLQPADDSQVNRLPPALRRGSSKMGIDKKPSTLADIRDSVSFLIEEPDSQSMTIDLGLSDSEDEPEKYLDLDRHLKAIDESEDDDDAEDLADFIDDDSQREAMFKLPNVPASSRAPYTERRTKTRNVVDRLSLMRQASSSSTSSIKGGKMAFFTAKTSSMDIHLGKIPNLLRRATTNSSLGSMAGREESATGSMAIKERGQGGKEKVFVRKGAGGQRNAVNYRVKPAEARMSERAGVRKAVIGKAAKGDKGGFLGGLFRGDSWA